MQGGRIVLTASTDAFGRYIAHDLPSGTYTVSVRLMGFRIQSREMAVGTLLLWLLCGALYLWSAGVRLPGGVVSLHAWRRAPVGAASR